MFEKTIVEELTRSANTIVHSLIFEGFVRAAGLSIPELRELCGRVDTARTTALELLRLAEDIENEVEERESEERLARAERAAE